MKDLGLPIGEYKFAHVTMNNYVHVDGKVICNIPKRFEKETKAVGDLIADAGNTALKCGLLPSELLKQRNNLREALVKLRDWVVKIDDWSGVGDPPIDEIQGVLCEIDMI